MEESGAGTLASSNFDSDPAGFILPTSGGSISNNPLEVLETFK